MEREFIKQKCVIQNTDILKRSPMSARYENGNTAATQLVRVGFVDVLIALNAIDSEESDNRWGDNHRLLCLADNLEIEFAYPELIQRWNLLRDDLDVQSDECVELIYKLLN